MSWYQEALATDFCVHFQFGQVRTSSTRVCEDAVVDVCWSAMQWHGDAQQDIWRWFALVRYDVFVGKIIQEKKFLDGQPVGMSDVQYQARLLHQAEDLYSKCKDCVLQKAACGESGKLLKAQVRVYQNMCRNKCILNINVVSSKGST